MMGMGNTRLQVGVTPNVQLMAWLVLTPSILVALTAIASITCFWKRTVRGARAEAADLANATRDAGGADTSRGGFVNTIFAHLKSAYTSFNYHSGVQGPHFYRFMWCSEVFELFFQFLAIQQLSEAGISRESLGLYTGTVFLNVCTQIVTYLALRSQQDRESLGRMTQRVLILDCLFDLL